MVEGAMKFLSLLASLTINLFSDAAEVHIVREFSAVLGSNTRLTHIAMKVKAGCCGLRV
jgi:hypothetical protein